MALTDVMARNSQPISSAPVNALRRKGTAALIEDTDSKVIQVGDFLIVVGDTAPGFWVCQVVKIITKKADGDTLAVPKFKVHWWQTRHKHGWGRYVECTSYGSPQCDVIDMDTIMFVFAQLTSAHQHIPRQIQRELKKDYKDRLPSFSSDSADPKPGDDNDDKEEDGDGDVDTDAELADFLID